MFKPDYKITNKMVGLLASIIEVKAIIDRAKILPQHELRLRRQALVRMTHSSTAIEGNLLNVQQVGQLAINRKIDAPSRDIFEVQNYIKALKYIQQVVDKKQKITEKTVLKIHNLVTANTLPKEQSGCYRKGPIYVVKRQLGISPEVVYTGPKVSLVSGLMKDLINWIQKTINEDINPILVAGIVHKQLAIIHPFSDGNGRTARALATLILYQRGYDFRRLFALEDYYNNDRPKYYSKISVGKNYESRQTDFTSWLEYFIFGFKQEIDEVKEKVVGLSLKKLDDKIQSKVFLNKDQLQIIDFLDQLGKINVKDVIDILHCPKRTAQLNLQKLKKLGIIKQVGKGPASAYLLN